MITNQFIFGARSPIVLDLSKRFDVIMYQFVAISVDYHVLFKVDM